MRLKKISSLRIINSVKKMQNICMEIRLSKNSKIVLVPTMGALHEGHIALIERAKATKAIVIVSIFLNPKQFNEKKDLLTYPKTFHNDKKKLKGLKVDYLFAPKVKEIYSLGFQTKIAVQDFKNHLCGLSRDGHFDSVATIVLKLFNITMPHIAVFGEKDLQQLVIIKKMIEDLNLSIKIIPHKIIRESDGLAMSSRNVKLTNKNREIAPIIYKGLKKMKLISKLKKRASCKNLVKTLRDYYSTNGINNVEYIEIIDTRTMTYPRIPSKDCHIVVAAKIGNVRLIDNLKF